ncbi:tRNA wybutosine-synthesizing protein 3 homolog [Brienomyrus brachyistius]|uniref:tRNA wybutosine-synthesizing protein 3 homolog n=1 Tax=Brienomyrus brachyistius TaxID=42636 RepID=UPI0020B1A693|nr:tRNA wybutosine-synthesizing protein 3 homolog [Brienomyrus brachyistius]
MDDSFLQWKKQCMSKIDLSKKGSVDEDISDVVAFINDSENYFTTSSCSGRITLIDGVSACSEVQKKDCNWLFVTHQKCQSDDVVASLERARGDAAFRFEPFVLHVQCRRLEDAQLLHSVAVNSGFRNSGMTVGKKGKIITAVRSTHCLEVPLTHEGQQLVSVDYISFLVEVANQKMEENFRRMRRFYDCLQSAMCAEQRHSLKVTDAEAGKSVYKRRRRKAEDPEAACHSDKDDASPEEDGALEGGIHLLL